jgi:hypothetical protein
MRPREFSTDGDEDRGDQETGIIEDISGAPYCYFRRQTISRNRIEMDKENIRIAHGTGCECLLLSSTVRDRNAFQNETEFPKAEATVNGYPKTYEEGMESPDHEPWKKATGTLQEWLHSLRMVFVRGLIDSST